MQSTRFACWIAKLTDTHSLYEILIAFPPQQWLHERTSVFCYMYIACLVRFTSPCYFRLQQYYACLLEHQFLSKDGKECVLIKMLLRHIVWTSTPTTMKSLLVTQQKFFLTNNENHNLDTRQRNNLYLPQANLTIYQKGAYYSGIKIFNNLPLEIKNVASNQKKFLNCSEKIFIHLFILHS
jgi:hypothetical protein